METLSHEISKSDGVRMGEYLYSLCYTNCSVCKDLADSGDLGVSPSETELAYPIIYVTSLLVYVTLRCFQASHRGESGPPTTLIFVHTLLQLSLTYSAHMVVMNSGIYRMLDSGSTNEYDCEDCLSVGYQCDWGGDLTPMIGVSITMSYLSTLVAGIALLLIRDDVESSAAVVWFMATSALCDNALPLMSIALVARESVIPECEMDPGIIWGFDCNIRYSYPSIISSILIINLVSMFLSAIINLITTLSGPESMVGYVLTAAVSRVIVTVLAVVLRIQLKSNVLITAFTSIQPFFILITEVVFARL
jgi:hypothetical protein